MLEDLKLKDLMLVTELGRFDSLRSLSRFLKVEPQNLSKKVKNIEANLGVRLIERSAKGVVLTESGLQVVAKCKEVLSSINEIHQFKQRSITYKDHLNICSRGYLVQALSGPLTQAFEQNLPATGLRFMDLSSEAMEKSARENQVDIVFSFGEIDLGKNWHRCKVGKVTSQFYVRENHPLKTEVNLNELKDYRFVGVSYIEGGRTNIPNLLGGQGSGLNRGFDSENANYTKEILKYSNQIGFLPDIAVRNELLSGKLKTIKIKGFPKKPMDVFLDVHMDTVNQIVQNRLKLVSKEVFGSKDFSYTKLICYSGSILVS